ncbi:MAG TPA: acyl-CoA carboxylase subunit epsilon [Terriglobales bacterium]|nr:acyl-CoA carboxylase subunit epsilon [Terriglobales bacterium]
MKYSRFLLGTFGTLLVLLSLGGAQATPTATKNDHAAILWRDPSDIHGRNLTYGPGGEAHMPPKTFTFEKESKAGSNPKFEVRDSNGVKWTAKMGVEAKPETAATHLLWSLGYFTDEDYFLPEIKVDNMPAHLHRGQKYVDKDGIVKNVRLERHMADRKEIGNWKWKQNDFTGTREFNGLRVMMALMNSWDLKDENNAIYRDKDDTTLYVVSDLGATFGTTGYSWTHAMARGNLKSYRHSKFINKVTPQYVDFNVPTRPALIYFFNVPGLFRRLGMRWIGKQIPTADVKWMASLLSQLSSEQILDAFRSAGYGQEEAQGFATVVEGRIADLNKRLQ